MSKRMVAYELVTQEGWIVGLVDEGEPGYSATTYGPYDTQEEARAVADGINEARGFDRSVVLDVVLSSMSVSHIG